MRANKRMRMLIGCLFFVAACDTAEQKFGVVPPPPPPANTSPRAHVVKGYVVGPDGRPMLGAWLEYNTDFSLFDGVRVQIDSAGNYRFDVAPSLQYVEVRAGSNDPGWASEPIVMLRLDTLPDTVRVDFRLKRRQEIAFVRDDQIFLMYDDVSAVTPLTKGPAGVTAQRGHPTGGRLHSRRSQLDSSGGGVPANLRIAVMNTDGSDFAWLTSDSSSGQRDRSPATPGSLAGLSAPR